MIDTKKPVRFYDDRGKDKKTFEMGAVLYQNERVCLCLIGPDEVLFSLDDGAVLTVNYQFWYAENYEG